MVQVSHQIPYFPTSSSVDDLAHHETAKDQQHPVASASALHLQRPPNSPSTTAPQSTFARQLTTSLSGLLRLFTTISTILTLGLKHRPEVSLPRPRKSSAFCTQRFPRPLHVSHGSTLFSHPRARCTHALRTPNGLTAKAFLIKRHHHSVVLCGSEERWRCEPVIMRERGYELLDQLRAWPPYRAIMGGGAS